jgi:hypothetical protein
MFFNTDEKSKAQVTTARAFRHMLIFQIKLAADALRDLILSPISILVFIADAVRKPALEDSLYLRLMLLGRKSDRLINLFDEHKNAGQYTVDQAVHEAEQLVRRSKGHTKEQEMNE